jgi:hypothetical protein
MHLKASKYLAVFVLYVSFSYPVPVGHSISLKANQMGPVVMLVHVARLSKCKVGLLLSFGVVDLLAFGRLRGAFYLSVWLRFTGIVDLWNFPYQLLRA